MIRELSIPKRKNISEKNESDTYYTKEELQEFFSCLELLKDRRAYTFFRILAFVGLRKGEAMALTWNDINFSNNIITINKTLVELQNGDLLVQDTKTESSNRIIKLWIFSKNGKTTFYRKNSDSVKEKKISIKMWFFATRFYIEIMLICINLIQTLF